MLLCKCYMLIDWPDNIAMVVCGWILLIKKHMEAAFKSVAINRLKLFFISLFCVCHFIFTRSPRIICLNHMNCLRFRKKEKHISVGDIRLEYFSYPISAHLTPIDSLVLYKKAQENAFTSEVFDVPFNQVRYHWSQDWPSQLRGDVPKQSFCRNKCMETFPS